MAALTGFDRPLPCAITGFAEMSARPWHAGRSLLPRVADRIVNTGYGHYEDDCATRSNLLFSKFNRTRNGPAHGEVHLPAESA